MRLYIASKMKGLYQYGFPKFMEVEEELTQRGHTCFNPARFDLEQGFYPDTKEEDLPPLSTFMKRDLPAMLECDAVCVFGDWLSSKGANIEVFVALSCGLPVLRYPDLERMIPYPPHVNFWIVNEIMQLGAKKHIEGAWAIEPQDNHLDKGIRHCLTAKLIRDGNQKPDGEAHLKLSLCRIGFGATQAFGESYTPSIVPVEEIEQA